MHRWSDLLRRRGVAALLESITHSEGLPARVLARPDGERTLTDLRHIGQLLHGEAVAGGLGVTALASWLRRRISEARQDVANEDRSRRLESDSEAVQVLTVHRSKGLEFPIVYCPYLWNEGWIDRKDPPVFHDPANGDRRTIDVGGKDGPDFSTNWQRYVEEERGEELRLAYVALTRARHQAVVWWATSFGSRESALGRLLFAPDGSMLATPPSETAGGRPCRRARRQGARNHRRGALLGRGRRQLVAGDVPAGAQLDVRTFDRTIDSWWRRVSYTGLTAGTPRGGRRQRAGADAGSRTSSFRSPRPSLAPAGSAAEPALRSVQLPLAAMPGGARVGSLVHAVLERVDFAAPDLAGTIATALAERLAWSRVDVGPVDAVVDGLVAVDRDAARSARR